jgi:hypothetical protein
MFFGSQINVVQMARECGVDGGTEIHTDFWCENEKERYHL